MNYNWFSIFNLPDFINTGLVSRTLQVFLSGIGPKQVMVTNGNLVSVVIDGVILPIEFMGKNPYGREGYAVYKNEAGEVFLGVEVPE